MLPPKYCKPMAATSFEPWEEPAFQGIKKLSFQPFGHEQIAPGSFESPVFTN